MSTENKKEVSALITRGLIWSLSIGVIFLIALIIFVSTHLEETRELLEIVKSAKPAWLALAVLAQIVTYVFTGAIWYLVARSAKYYLSLRNLTHLAIEQTGVNQLIPIGGVAGNIIIVKAMTRLGLPSALAIEVLFVEMLSYYISFSFVTFVSLLILAFYHNITPIILSLVGAFFLIELFITIIIWAAVNHKKLTLPGWIKKRKLMIQIFGAMEDISSDRVFSTKLLIETSLLRLGVFLLDAGTLFMIMKAIGAQGTLTTAFVAFVIASLAGAITFMPGGLGGFEAGSIATLALLGVPLGSAIIATIFLRILILWIPLVPGLMMAREDLGNSIGWTVQDSNLPPPHCK